YRNFLVQSSPDLLAEASASALGVIGEYGEPQSALFRILIDEFGYGAHHKKHAVFYRATMRSFDLDDAYNGYWPWFDTAALKLHNVIHWLFQNPRNFFRQVGFLLYAETAYQRSTLAHHRYLREFHPDADARYFGEHAHIDLHHTRMVIDEAVTPLVARFGAEVATEIIAGAEMTKAAFARAGEHLLGVSQAFAAAPSARFGVEGQPRARLGRPVTPASPPHGAPVQVGVLGVLQDGRDFAAFPATAIGRVTA
ncbi:MAG TPA: iron-containing redox enzyme family protein, partial [Phenylobacterium sp.]|nr:iron-containing redox enzyme family protein [Phenylobacterium sp.]